MPVPALDIERARRRKHMKYSLYERQGAVVDIMKFLKPGRTVYTMVHNVSRSGMMRTMSVKIIDGERILTLDWAVSRILGLPTDKYGRLKVRGTGMDMGFDIVYSLGSVLWPKGTDEAHSVRNGEPDFSGGYALKQEWL